MKDRREVTRGQIQELVNRTEPKLDISREILQNFLDNPGLYGDWPMISFVVPEDEELASLVRDCLLDYNTINDLESIPKPSRRADQSQGNAHKAVTTHVACFHGNMSVAQMMSGLFAKSRRFYPASIWEMLGLYQVWPRHWPQRQLIALGSARKNESSGAVEVPGILHDDQGSRLAWVNANEPLNAEEFRFPAVEK